MTSRRRFIAAGAAGIALAGAATRPLGGLAQESTSTATATDDDQQGGADPVVGTPILRPAIDLIRAQEIALEGNDGAVVTGVDLNGDDGLLEYSVSLDNGVEVDIDATTGEVISTESGDDDDDDEDDNGSDDQGGTEDDSDEEDDNGGADDDDDDDD